MEMQSNTVGLLKTTVGTFRSRAVSNQSKHYNHTGHAPVSSAWIPRSIEILRSVKW